MLLCSAIFLLLIFVALRQPIKGSKKTIQTEQGERYNRGGNNNQRSSDNSSRNWFIESEVEKVFKLVGASETIDSMPLIEMILDGEISEVASKIAQKMQIMHPRITIERQKQGEKDKLGRNILAKVFILKKEPIIGSRDFNYQNIKISIYPDFNNYPDQAIFVLAHELSHKVLHSIDRHRDEISAEEDERQTDICAILLGFRNSFSVMNNISVGYLEKDEGELVCRKYDEIISKSKKSRQNAVKIIECIHENYPAQVEFLKDLYAAKKIQGYNKWHLDYSTMDDYNRLLVYTNIIELAAVADIMKKIRIIKESSNKNHYNQVDLELINWANGIETIMGTLKIPDNKCHQILQKYS